MFAFKKAKSLSLEISEVTDDSIFFLVNGRKTVRVRRGKGEVMIKGRKVLIHDIADDHVTIEFPDLKEG